MSGPPLTFATPLDAALSYAARGWRVVPIGQGQKHPDLPAWQDAATTDPDTIARWYAERPARGVGIATGDGLLVLDVDTAGGKVGADTLAELEAVHGALPDTVEAVTGSGGRHLYFAHSNGIQVNNSAGRLGPDLDIRANGGQVLAPPTIHPTTGHPYAWEAEHHPDDVAVADAPAWLLELLAEPDRVRTDSDAPERTFADAVTARDRYDLNPNAQAAVEGLLIQAGWARHHTDQGIIHLTRPGKDRREGTSATLGALNIPGAMHCFTSSTPPFVAQASYDPSDVLRLLCFDGDPVRTDEWLVAQGWGATSLPATPTVLGPIQQLSVPSPFAGAHLPDTFWQARPVLAHIRQAARAALVGADAVLGTVLTRVAASTSYTVELPGIVGRPMGLTFYAAAVGAPSSGKSAAADVGADLLPAPARVMDRMPIGSGEGFVDCLFEMVDEVDPNDENGKRRIKVKTQTRFAAIFNIDEGSVLGDLGQRSGTTIMPTLRTAYTHGTLGATNASAERKRLLNGTDYVYGVTMGIQPDKAGQLLGDAAAGTPQRFLWLMATDPAIDDEDVDDPGPLAWQPPTALELDPYFVQHANGLRRPQIAVATEIRREIRQNRRGGLRGAMVDDGEAHTTLVRLKTAALLAILDRRLDINTEDWHLAGVLIDTSRTVRLAVEASLRKVDAATNAAFGKRQAERKVIEFETVEARALASASRAAGKRCHGHAATHKEGSCTRHCLSSSMAGKHRALVAVDDALSVAMEQHWIIADGDRWRPGESRPA